MNGGQVLMTDEETYTKGNFSLTEWEDVNYCEHYFCKGDYKLSDREVVDLLNEQHETITQLQSTNMEMEDYLARLEEENEQLKKELESFKPVIFESDGKPVTLYKKEDV